MKTMNYRTAGIIATSFHIFLACFLMMDQHSDRFVTKSTPRSNDMASMDTSHPSEPQPIRAVSVDSQAVNETLSRLKAERAEKQQAELNHQRAVDQQLRMAQQQRIQEQKRIEQMKKEAAQLAISQQKKLAVERQHLKELADQKIKQEKNLAELKQQQIKLQKQQQDQQHLAELQKQKMAQDALAKEKAVQQEKVRLAQQAATAAAAQRSAQMSGEVNKYKALIIQAISQHWILPEHVNRQLFSQFRIRLAPNGNVLEVSLIRSSGDSVLDRSAQAAIYKASPLPVPSDQAMFNLFRDISLTVRPESARG